MGFEKGRESREDLKVGICGEHGGDPVSISFVHSVGLDYVSCSPFRVPIARLVAAQATLKEKGELAKPSKKPRSRAKAASAGKKKTRAKASASRKKPTASKKSTRRKSSAKKATVTSVNRVDKPSKMKKAARASKTGRKTTRSRSKKK
jgi:pyruvate,orthophosphate dikinase